jgi:hypothetical protein
MVNAKGLKSYMISESFDCYFNDCAVDGILGKAEMEAAYAEKSITDLLAEIPRDIHITEGDVRRFENSRLNRDISGIRSYTGALRKACVIA